MQCDTTLTLAGVDFTAAEIQDMPWGFIIKSGRKFYRGNIFDTPYDHSDHAHDFVEVGGARLFDFGPADDLN